MRAYFAGASSVGKTTLAREVARRYGLRLLPEVARAVLAEREYPGGLAAMAGDLAATTEFQREVWARQIAAEEAAADQYVSDRCADNLAYAALRAEPGEVARLLAEPRAVAYLERLRRSRVFLVRPHPHMLRADGVRADATWDDAVRVDGAVTMLLAALAIPYTPIDSPAVADRLRVVAGVLGDPGEPAWERTKDLISTIERGRE